MGNVLCGIVPTDMVCQREEQISLENEKNLIALHHYNSQIVDKKLAAITLFSQSKKPVVVQENNEEISRQVPLSMPVEFRLEKPIENPSYSLNEQELCVT